ncbi:MAG: class I SAM-dependent methyltransferase, partial [Planctomycetaceae bacterium]
MLPRVLEPEVMDTPEEAVAYDSMDHSVVNALFADQLVADLAAYRRQAGLVGGQRAMTLLDVGTGTAQIPIEICRRDPDVRIVALDLAKHMLTLGRRNVERVGLVDR